MPSIRIPYTFRRGRKAETVEVTLPSPGFAGTAPQPPLTDGDPRLQAFLRVNFDVLYDWNIQTGAVYFSEQLDDMLGLPPGAFPRSLAGWLERIHPDDHDAATAALWGSVAHGSTYNTEYRLRHNDGTWIAVSDQGVVQLDAAGQPANMIGAMRDVTTEREAQRAVREAEELRSVLFRIPSPAVQVDARGNYVDADTDALAFFEKSRDEMLSGNAGDDFPPEVMALIVDELESGQGVAELEVDCPVKGRIKTLILTVIPCSLGDERGYFLLGTDITERKAMQIELIRSERALRRQATILDERNAALRVLLEQREQDRAELEQRIVRNVERLIEPTLDRLSHMLTHRPERMEVEALRVNLREIVGPFGERLARAEGTRQPLTRRESAVANFVRLGKTTDEIAETLHISRSAVSFHRANVRRKMGLPKGGPTLSTHLANLGRP
jgi:PAS domain-containing protein/DNA-binding CsgD family transcriptional regulator